MRFRQKQFTLSQVSRVANVFVETHSNVFSLFFFFVFYFSLSIIILKKCTENKCTQKTESRALLHVLQTRSHAHNYKSHSFAKLTWWRIDPRPPQRFLSCVSFFGNRAAGGSDNIMIREMTIYRYLVSVRLRNFNLCRIASIRVSHALFCFLFSTIPMMCDEMNERGQMIFWCLKESFPRYIYIYFSRKLRGMFQRHVWHDVSINSSQSENINRRYKQISLCIFEKTHF